VKQPRILDAVDVVDLKPLLRQGIQAFLKICADIPCLSSPVRRFHERHGGTLTEFFLMTYKIALYLAVECAKTHVKNNGHKTSNQLGSFLVKRAKNFCKAKRGLTR